MNIDIFCRVIDNYGDIGVCWRLAKELMLSDHSVTIISDHLEVFTKIFHEVNPSKNFQICCFNGKNLKLYRWQDQIENYMPGDMVIEAFACNIPESFIEKFTDKTIWINLEYLSAEDWIEGCHKLPSLQNRGLKKFFFFPGFTSGTGGINFNSNTLKLDKKELRHHVCGQLGLNQDLSDRFWFFIFCYETPNIKTVIECVLKHHPETLLLLPESRSTDYLKNTGFFEELKNEFPHAVCHEYPMVEQSEFDKILGSTDLNLVRGEDSICQAMLYGTPFIWHIYEQDNNAHLEKLEAMLDRFCKFATDETASVIRKAMVKFNEKITSQDILCANFNEFMLEYDKICEAAEKWSDYLYANNNLSTNLLKFYYDLTERKF